MRFGSRKDDGARAHEVVPASRSAVEVGQQPVLPSKRLQRVAEHFHTQKASSPGALAEQWFSLYSF